ncbi:hypothetical protein Tco_0568063 [Tanacetum coccineum]
MVDDALDILDDPISRVLDYASRDVVGRSGWKPSRRIAPTTILMVVGRLGWTVRHGDFLWDVNGRYMFTCVGTTYYGSEQRASRLSEAEAVSRDPEDSEEPQGSDDRDTETAGTC